MIIKDLFKKDIFRIIPGVVTIGNEDEEQKWQELEEYVCTDEIRDSFRIFFRRYRESLRTPTTQIGVWITGFFGSGKSHFLKILAYILENEEVAGCEAVKYFDDKIKDELILADMRSSAKADNKVVLFNIDSKAKSDSKNKTQAIMDIMLRSFNEAIGYCGSSPWVADMERALDEEGTLNDFIARFEKLSKREWTKSRANALLNRDNIVKALMESRGMSEESARQFINDQTKNYTSTTEEFAKIVGEYCKKQKTRVVFLMDEVGQFVGDNTQLMLNLQTCVEDLGKYCGGQAWVIITSQQELKAMIDNTKDKQQDFSKIQGRFNTRILLSGANADEVIKKRILEKKDNAVTPLKSLYDANSSKLSNLILFKAKPSWSGYGSADDFKDVYPFVSYQFELLQKVFEAIREHGLSEGKHLSQNARSLLDAFMRSARKYGDFESGILVPFDSFYDTIEEFIDYDIKTVFTNASSRASIDSFAIRVLRVLFMIKHVKEMPATIDRLATLMVESIFEDKAALKERIADALKVLEEETLIQKNGEEYDFLTNEEQDVNKQIANTSYNEGEVKRNILDIIYDKIMESSKYRYEGRYDFGLNRYVDDEIKGNASPDNITVKVYTKFSGLDDPSQFAAESIQSNSIVVDLTGGTFTDELIRANKIVAFKRNNSASMSAVLTEIMAKKIAEFSDRTRRAEEIIRSGLRSAPIYIAGSVADIKLKDAKDRLNEAIKQMVEREYYKLGQVQYYYKDQQSVLAVLNDNDPKFDVDPPGDYNAAAYASILNKLKDDKKVSRKATVKSLLDYFSKKPFGWRDLDILGMLAVLFKHHDIEICIHDNAVDDKIPTFKNEFSRGKNTDTFVVRLKEKIDDALLYQVKLIMANAYDETLELDEQKLKEGVAGFFSQKKEFLSGLRIKRGDIFPGSEAVSKILKDFDAITKSNDTLTVLNEIIARKDSLEENAETLEQIESFYKPGSHQYQNYEDAIDIVKWYEDNHALEDLSGMSETVRSMQDVLSLDMPFPKMGELADLVFKAKELKTEVLTKKLNRTKEQLLSDKKTLEEEISDAVSADLSDEQIIRIKDKGEDLLSQYDEWLKSLSIDTPNMDSYLTASANSIKGFKDFIAEVMSESSAPTIKTKQIFVIDCVPATIKKIKSADDVEKVISVIREKLLNELDDNDELSLR